MIEEQLPAMGCSSCEGTLVSLLYYRHWAETNKPATAAGAEPKTAAVETSDTTTALACPKCSRIMTKYRLTGCVANRVDLCGLCDEAWLDRGEWELLEALHLSHKMPAIFTEQWQRQIRHEQSEATRQAILQRSIGAEGFARVEQFREWLTASRHKPEILVYLYRD
jgi:Zn-finger nucleic acid-binding protein